jgi:hypothetical protein
MRRIMRDYALSIVLGAVFLVTLVGAAISGWFEYASRQAAHGQPASLGGDDGYVWNLLEQVLQNWQSEFLALAVFIALASVLVHIGSPASKSTLEDRRRRITDIEARVDRLVAERARSRPEAPR